MSKIFEPTDDDIVPLSVFNEAVWDVVDEYFKPNKGYQLVKHQIESFNDFVLRKIDQIIEGFNPIEINHGYNPETEKFKYRLSLVIENPTLMKPIIYEKDGSTKTMTPSDARLRNFTYASAISIDISITAQALNDNGEYDTETKKIQGVSLGKVPIMVKSNYCILKNKSLESNECKFDYGGYFIINGNEKVVISQDRISENKTFVFLNNKISTYSHIAEIRSVQENRLGVPKITSIKLSAKQNQFGRYIRVNIHHIKTDIPLFILMKAFGLNNDKEIIQYIVYNCDDKVGMLIASQLMACVDEANHVMCQRDAIEYLAKYLNITGYPREYMHNKMNRINLVRGVLEKEVLPHVGRDLRKKALYLGYMVNKLIQCFIGLKEFDDRDSYINKRVDTPGVLLASIFRQYYGKMIKDMKNMVQKEINVGGWKVSNKLINVINKVNVYKIVKSTIIDSGLRYALATGNWGIRSNKNKQGVAQVLNRMSYNATLSHLRRVNTPIEKSGKLVQPRKLHATQWGVICPAETPEGSSVGLVKNMAIMNTVTICSNSTNIRELLQEELGVIVFGSENDYDISMFHNNTKVIVNGDIIGIHKEPNILYTELKRLKRSGSINTYTSIVWNFQNQEIIVSTEGGRCTRPLFIVDEQTRKCRFTLDVLKKLKSGNMSWRELVTGHAEQQSVIEYMDVEEVNSAMVAMTYEDFLGGNKKFTNMEIHASLIMGILANCIPFSDHNQAPRVAYQCIWSEENVLMADGSLKKLKHIEIGDHVVTFNPLDYSKTTAYVTDKLVQFTDKKVYKITTYSEREIVATFDHKFMTNQGWKTVQEIMEENDIKLGVQFRKTFFAPTSIEKENKLEILARIFGFACTSKGDRPELLTQQDADTFSADLTNLSLSDSDLRYLLTAEQVVPEWIMNGSQCIKREFLSAFQGAEGHKIDWTFNCAVTSQETSSTKSASSLQLFFEQLVTLFRDLDIDVSDPEITIVDQSKGKIKFGYKIINTKDNLIKYYETIGYTYAYQKQSESGVVVEYLRSCIMTINNQKQIERFMRNVSVKYSTMFIGIKSIEETPRCEVTDITVDSENQSFIGGDGFMVHNCSMGKQALGVYTSNYRHRFDTMGHVLNYGQRPLVRTNMSTVVNNDSMPCGINAIVAIATYTGFNQEDSVILNQSSVDRGLFTSTYYRTYKELNNKNHSNGEEEFFTKPDTDMVRNVKPYNYSKLDENGFVPENTPVQGGDVIIGKVMPTKIDNIIQYKDNSVTLKNNEVGFVDRNGANDKYFTNTNGDGYGFAKVRIRSDRTPTIGDKCCLTPDHEVLTKNGWKPIPQITKEDLVAQLANNHELQYVHPTELFVYDHEGDMYEVKSQQIDLTVTLNHKMYVRFQDDDKFQLIEAKDIVGRNVFYKKNIDKAYQDNDYYLQCVFHNGNEYYPSWVNQANNIQIRLLEGGYSGDVEKLNDSCYQVMRYCKNKDNEPLVEGTGEIVQYYGKVYCIEVPSHVFYVRKNGKPVWTGNSSRHGQLS